MEPVRDTKQIDRMIAWLDKKISESEERIAALQSPPRVRRAYAGYLAERNYLKKIRDGLS